jgi:arsenate reductase (thioredoxin)
MNTTKDNVLVLCSGNSCRSQMAEAFLRKYAGERLNVHSAGTEPKEIHPLAFRVMNEVGLDMKGQYSKGTDVYLGKLLVHYLIVVCSRAAEKCPAIWPGSPHMQVLVWPFDDPATFIGTEEETLDKFRQVRDQIEARIKAWLAEKAQDAR